MRFVNNPYMTLNYGVLGKGGSGSIDYELTIGKYDSYTSSPYWEPYYRRGVTFTKHITSLEARMLFNRIKIEVNKRKDLRLLKKGDHEFKKDRHNFLVYTHQHLRYSGYRQRCFISFKPIIKDKNDWTEEAYKRLPFIDKPKGV